jgi:LysM repeat protein
MKKALMIIGVLALVLLASRPVLASTGTIHIVQPGQTLLAIARWYGVDYLTLARTNGITNPNRIYVGQRLLIPSTGGTAVRPGTTYTVRAGDTLYSIAARSGVSVWAIAQANAIYDLTRIYVGQRLVIPGAQPVPVPTPRPVPVPTTGWRGEYYAGTSLAGAPCFVRYDSAINFHWGTGGPAACVGTDLFSVRWARTFTFRGGVYRFTTVVDDGVRILIDGVVVLDAWKVQPETRYSVDVSLTPGSHTVTVEYFEHTGVATIQMTFARLGDVVVTPVPTPVPTIAPPSAWYGEYFNNMSVSGTPAATRWDPAIGFEWGTGSPVAGVRSDQFSVRWTRNASFYSDNYAFCAMSDDGVRIYLDGRLVLDEWHASNALAYCTEADVTAGIHQVRVEYYEDGGNALIYVWWERR